MNRRHELERIAAEELSAAARRVLLAVEPVRVRTGTMHGPVFQRLMREAMHVHGMDGFCLRNRFGPLCQDEFDWFKRRDT